MLRCAFVRENEKRCQRKVREQYCWQHLALANLTLPRESLAVASANRAVPKGGIPSKSFPFVKLPLNCRNLIASFLENDPISKYAVYRTCKKFHIPAFKPEPLVLSNGKNLPIKYVRMREIVIKTVVSRVEPNFKSDYEKNMRQNIEVIVASTDAAMSGDSGVEFMWCHDEKLIRQTFIPFDMIERDIKKLFGKEYLVCLASLLKEGFVQMNLILDKKGYVRGW
jgi:hypothetical protein